MPSFATDKKVSYARHHLCVKVSVNSFGHFVHSVFLSAGFFGENQTFKSELYTAIML